MRTMQRAAAMVGLALMTGGLFSVTATAASAAPTQESTTTQSTESDRRHGGDDRGDWRDRRHRDRTYTAGWFDSRRECMFRGWRGERRGWWEDPRCYRVSRDLWVLRVERSHNHWR